MHRSRFVCPAAASLEGRSNHAENRKRSIFCLILAALLGLGLAFFCFRFVVDGGDWASYPYNRHLYNNAGQLKGGTILDRDGDMLSTLDEDGNRIYNDDATVRRATLHAVGDKTATSARVRSPRSRISCPATICSPAYILRSAPATACI